MAGRDCVDVRGARAGGARDSRAGITLIPTVVAATLLAGLASVVLVRTEVGLQIAGKLIEVNARSLQRSSVYEMARVDVARAILRPAASGGAGAIPLDGTPRPVDLDGVRWHVAFQNVQGLVDLYLAGPDLLRRAGFDPRAVEAGRRRAGLDGGVDGRFATLSQTLARFGLPPEARGITTQRAAVPGIDPRSVPARLGRLAADASLERVTGQPRTVLVSIAPAL